MKLSDTEALRQIIMEDIFDQKLALRALAHLDNIKTDVELSKVRVTDREGVLENRLEKLEVKHQQACDLLRDLTKVVGSDRGHDYYLLYQYKDFLEK